MNAVKAESVEEETPASKEFQMLEQSMQSAQIQLQANKVDIKHDWFGSELDNKEIKMNFNVKRKGALEEPEQPVRRGRGGANVMGRKRGVNI